MDTKEEETSRTPKKQKIEKERQQLVQVTKPKWKNKETKIKGPSFEIHEYTFDKVSEGATYKYKSKTELLDRYKDVGEQTFNEKLKLYDEVRKFSGQDVSVVNVRDKDK